MTIEVKAPAKINLSLDIVSKRPDGYHDVAMVMQSVSLFDTVTVTDDENAEGDAVTVSCDNEEVPLDEKNIAVKAVRAFYAAAKVTPRPLSIRIEKRIPTQAGLGGGSADGAGVILALNRIFETRLTMKEMAAVGEKVGADVPFCLLGGTMLATGTGTTLKRLPALQKCAVVICKPQVSVSTAEAYACCDQRPPKGFLYTDEVVARLCRHDIRGLSSCLYNEFEQVLNLPEIVDIKREMLRHKALGASMSGSGSAVFALFHSMKKAEACKNSLKEKYNQVFLCEPLKDGARIE